MPPFDITPGMRNLLGVWGSIVGAANEGLSTQSLYSAIYNAQIDAGGTPGGFTMRDLNPLRSMATGWRTTQANIARAQDSSPLGTDHIALAPWSRDVNSRNANPLYEIRYEYLTDPALPPGEQWVTVPTEQAGMPATIGQLRDLVNQHAAELDEGQKCPPRMDDQSFAGVGNILVVAV